MMNCTTLLLAALLMLPVFPQAVGAIPYFARKYGVTCSQCHVSAQAQCLR